MPADTTRRGTIVDRLTLESVTLGVSIRDCSSRLESTARARVYDRLRRTAGHLSSSVMDVADRYGGDVNAVYLAVTPVGAVFDGFSASEYVSVAETLDRAARDMALTGIGGFTALSTSAMSAGDEALLQSIPDVVASTEAVFMSVACASSERGINFRTVDTIASLLSNGVSRSAVGPTPSRISVLANASGSSPLFPGAFHGIGEAEITLGVAVSMADTIAAVAGLPLDEAARALAELKVRLERGAQFFGLRCRELLTERSGLAVLPGRVELTLAPRPTPARGEASPLQNLDLIRAPGFLPTTRPAPIHRAVAMYQPGIPARDLAHVMARHLSDAVAGGWEADLSLANPKD